MDTSQLQSSSKCGSDFSIARILSSDSTIHPVSSSENIQMPDWLCCTRYRPPRLPRVVSGVGGRARRSGRHARVPFTAVQAAALEAAYARSPYLAPPALRALAAALHLRDDRTTKKYYVHPTEIKIWFQNRRARERREKCANVTPPLAVTLPSTANAQVSWMANNSSWTTTGVVGETRTRPPDYNCVLKNESTTLENTSIYELNTTPSENSFSESSGDDSSDLPLDIETIED